MSMVCIWIVAIRGVVGHWMARAGDGANSLVVSAPFVLRVCVCAPCIRFIWLISCTLFGILLSLLLLSFLSSSFLFFIF